VNTSNKVLEKIKDSPSEPGVYIFKKNGIPIYIGKAKNLKNRLKSYLNFDPENKSFEIINNSDSLDYIITSSELEAEVLESKLIYQHKPIFNIKYKYRNPLKYIAIIDKDGFPYLSFVNKFTEEVTEILGSFIYGISFKELSKILGSLFGVRQCNYNFKYKKPKLCMYYYLNQCSGPCQGKISKENYLNNFNKAVEFLKMGDFSSLKEELLDKIKELSEIQDYEKAIIYRNHLQILENYTKKVLLTFKDQKYKICYLYYAHENNLNLLGIFFPPSYLKILELENVGELKPSQVIFNTILEIINFNFVNEFIVQNELYKELKNFIENYSSIINDEISQKIKDIKILHLADENFEYLKNICIQKLQYYKQNDSSIILSQLSKILRLDVIYRLEAIDVSHFYGEDVYGSLVVFEKNYFNKSKYRIFLLSHKHNDLENIYELIFRRFKNDDPSMIDPQVLIVDGSINQLKYAHKALIDSGKENIRLLSIEKPDDKIYYLQDQKIITLNLSDNLLNFIRRLRDEAHRFANSRRKKFSQLKILKK